MVLILGRLPACVEFPFLFQQEAGRVAHDSAQAFPASTRACPSTSTAAEQQGQGTESLRSSDEFPANKENNQSRFGVRRHAPAGGKPSMPGFGSGGAIVVSEQVLAQEALYALQVSLYALLRSCRVRVYPASGCPCLPWSHSMCSSALLCCKACTRRLRQANVRLAHFRPIAGDVRLHPGSFNPQCSNKK